MKKTLTYLVLVSLFSSCGGASADRKETVKEVESPSTAEQKIDNVWSNAEERGSEEGLTVDLEEDAAPTPEILAVFRRFRDAMLKEDTVALKGLIKGKAKTDGSKTISATEIIEELDAPQRMVLEKRTDWAIETDTDTQQADCLYRDFFNWEDNDSDFSWAVGCSQLVKEETGEYQTIFIFRKINGVFYLSEIRRAG